MIHDPIPAKFKALFNSIHRDGRSWTWSATINNKQVAYLYNIGQLIVGQYEDGNKIVKDLVENWWVEMDEKERYTLTNINAEDFLKV